MRYVVKTFTEECGHGAKMVARGGKDATASGRMLLAGKTSAESAIAVGVARQTVYAWKWLLDEGLGDLPFIVEG